MTIEFSCPQCAQQIRTPDSTAGKRGKCPSCAAIVRIPAGAPAVAAPAPAPEPAAADAGPIEFFCSLCGQLVRTPRSAAGKKGKCPHCQGVLQIPLKSRSPKATPAAPPTAKQPAAARQTPPKPAPMEDIGLAPLDDLATLPEPTPQPQRFSKTSAKPAAKARPAPTADDDDGGDLRLASNLPLPPLAPLAPLDGTSSGLDAGSGLAPLGGDLFGGTDPLASANAGLNLGGDPFASSGSAFGSAGSTPLAPANPYSAPAAVPSGPKGPDPGYLVLPAIFQLLGVLPFFLLCGFYLASIVFASIVVYSAPEGSRVAEAASRAGPRLAFHIISTIIALGGQIWIMIGSVQMLMRRNYDNALAAAWMSVVPCFGLCAFPFGIWSLIMLNKPEYKRMFRD